MSIHSFVFRLKASSARPFALSFILFGLVAAVAVPFLMLTIGGRDSNNLPWYVWLIMPALLIAVIAAGFFMFKRGSPDAEDISISPKNR